MIISFPTIVSNNVNKDILPYLIKIAERKVAVEYAPIIAKEIETELNESVNTSAGMPGRETFEKDGIVLTVYFPKQAKDVLKETTTTAAGVQIEMKDSREMTIGEPYWVKFRVTTTSRVTKDVMVGFKAVVLMVNNLDEYLSKESEFVDSLWYKLGKYVLSDKVLKYWYYWYLKRSNKEYVEAFRITDTLYESNFERIVIASVADLTKEQVNKLSEDLDDMNISSFYLDDNLNQVIYYWNYAEPGFFSMITYDKIYMSALKQLPEMIDKAKQKNTSLFSKRISKSLFQKIIETIFGKQK